MFGAFFSYIFTMKMEPISSETSVNIYHITLPRIPEATAMQKRYFCTDGVTYLQLV
jgi:hypothetical protein